MRAGHIAYTDDDFLAARANDEDPPASMNKPRFDLVSLVRSFMAIRFDLERPLQAICAKHGDQRQQQQQAQVSACLCCLAWVTLFVHASPPFNWHAHTEILPHLEDTDISHSHRCGRALNTEFRVRQMFTCS